MLVLVTNREDLTADWMVLELEQRGADFVRFNSEDYPTQVQLNWAQDDATLGIRNRRLNRSDITAVWWRRPLAPHMPEELPEAEALWAAGEALAAMDGFWRTTDAHWVNRPACNAAADSKPEQLVRAARMGFEVPTTLVTNAAEALRDFLSEHTRAICKSMREARVPHGSEESLFYTSALAADDLGELGDFGPEPYLFQALVAKRYDLRVTVIGDQAWACRIDSQDIPEALIDWRLSQTEQLVHTVEEIPPRLAERCVELTHSYGLRYSAIDLGRRLDGGYTFFELNPNGQWAWVEQLTGLPLRARLADELLRVL